MQGQSVSNRYPLVAIMLLFITLIHAQYPPAAQGSISGIVVESKNQQPIEYANVVLYNQKSKVQITGTITDKNGFFRLNNLQYGIYLLEIKFIGFNAFIIENLTLRPGHSEIDLGNITLSSDVLAMEGVEVVGEKPVVEFKIDKKVINVSQQFTNISGTAVDVLENIPSVSVDIEGNVSLRGSENFNLLIDGRPSILDPNDALKTIPASTIENIEIITNPSAKYDPDGVTGIINIITKKTKVTGITGIVNLSAGVYGQYGGDFLISFRKKRLNYYLGADFNHRNMPGEMYSESRTIKQDTIAYLVSDGDSKFGGNFGGVRGGVDFDLSKADQFRFSFRYGNMNGIRESDTKYKEWNNLNSLVSPYTSISTSDRGRNFGSLNLDYNHKFKKEGHELSSRINFSQNSGEEESLNELVDLNDSLTSGQRSTESGPSTHLRFNFDYKLPLWSEAQIEAGYQNRYELSEETNQMYLWNPCSQEYELKDLYSHTTDYTDEIQSTYLIYKGKQGIWGYQGGIRGEYTYRYIEMTGEPNPFSIDRWDFYPTLHTSLDLGHGQQIMASYTRRINRPRGWDLEPFLTWMDAYNLRRGNPNLKPEFVDSYEAGYQKIIGKSLFSLEGYYRITRDKIDRIRSVYDYDQKIFLNTIDNIGQDYALGTETMLTLFPFKWWNLNLMGNLYDYRVKGTLFNESVNRGSFNWSFRINNTIRLGSDYRIQFSANYESPSVSSQGRREAMFFTNAAIRRDFGNRKFTATLQIRDILGSATRKFTAQGADFYSENQFSRAPRMLSVTLTYNINNYKAERDNNRQQTDENSSEFLEDSSDY